MNASYPLIWLRSKPAAMIAVYVLIHATALAGAQEEAEFEAARTHGVPFSYFEGKPLEIGNAVQLFVDDYIVEDRWMLERRAGKVQKHIGNPVLKRDKPWEDMLGGFPCVLYDTERKLYRMWYECFNLTNYFAKNGPSYYVGYAESKDGYLWTKPELEGFPFGEYQRTNIVYTGKSGKRCSGKQVLPNPDQSDPARRFLMVYIDGSIQLAHSPDGLHWETEAEPLFKYHSDFPNHLVWEPVRKRWHLYVRPAVTIQGDEGAIPEGLRHTNRRLALSTSPDLKTWSVPRTIMYPDERDQPDYDNAYVFNRHGIYFAMYSQMFAETGNRETETYLATSRDGIHFERTWDRKPFIPRGPEGAFDHGQVEPGANPPIEIGEDLLIYYYASPVGQGDWMAESSIGVCRLRKDRFIGQHAGDKTGYLVTRAIVLEGSRLLINCSALYETYHQKTSGIDVEIIGPPDFGSLETRHGKHIPGFTLDECDRIMTDNPAHVVTWKKNGDISPLKGKTVQLRFRMRNAAIYGFQIAP